MKTSNLILLLTKCTHHALADEHYPDTKTEPKHKHVIPTLLSVEDHVTRESLNALHNSLYDELKESTFVRTNKSLRGKRVSSYKYSPLSFISEMISSQGKLIGSHLAWLLLQRDDESKIPIFWANKQSVTFNSNLMLSWKEDSVDDDDVISLHCPADDDDANFKDAATIIQARSMGIRSKNDNVVIASNKDLVSHWEFRFPVIREDSCEFRLWSRDKNELHLISKTEKIMLPSGKTLPTALHLSLTSSPDKINIHFTTGHLNHASDTKMPIPVVEYSSSITGEWIKVEGTSDTYAATDMCEAPANVVDVGKFIDPGLLHTVQISDLEYDTEYVYKVGVVSNKNKYDNIVWSQIHTFKSPSPPPENLPADYKIKFLVYGDQGVPGGCNCDSSANITDMVTKEVMLNEIRAIHHIGDLAYAVGAAHVWDLWFEMIQPFTTKVPLMVGIGNHEYIHMAGGDHGRDPSGVHSAAGYHPSWGNMVADSGGECGVPVHKRFRMPSGSEGSNGVFWYSYDMAMVHVIMISSEHDMSKRSRQYEWLKRDLMRVNRTLTPWVFVESHRPMYNGQINRPDGETIVGLKLREEFEDLLYENNVDVYFSGHYHSYLRTCSGLYKSICNNNGTLHITVGTAGFIIDEWDIYPQTWTEVYFRENGYGRVEVNMTNFLFEFIGNDDKSVLDSIMLIKG